MQPFRVHSGIVVPLDRANVDTDAIIPKQFLKSIKRSGFGPNLFDAWRFLDVGEPVHAADQVGALGEPVRAARVEVQVTAHARGGVDDDVHRAGPQPLDRLPVEGDLA